MAGAADYSLCKRRRGNSTPAARREGEIMLIMEQTGFTEGFQLWRAWVFVTPNRRHIWAMIWKGEPLSEWYVFNEN